MASRPSIVCPIDFSAASRTALTYAATIADHFGARLLPLSVDDPALVSMAETAGLPSLEAETRNELRRFVVRTLPWDPVSAAMLQVHVRVGKPATEILRVADEHHSGLIVMNPHGRRDVRKPFFGSTSERVLREAPIPVLMVPAQAAVPASLSNISRHVRRVVAPVDLTEASPHQARIAAEIAVGLGVPLLVAYVLEPMRILPKVRAAIRCAEGERRVGAEAKLRRLLETAVAGAPAETVVLSGDPSEEIVNLADTHGSNLIVMGLHSSGLLGPRMGSVTYRVLCLTRALVLALPPNPAASAHWLQAAHVMAAP